MDRAKVARGLAHCARHGITSMVNMDGNRYTLELLRELREAGELTARVKVPYHLKPGVPLSDLDRADRMTAEYDDEWLQSGFVKMFMDGVMDSGTAWRLDDYPGQPGHRSVPLFEPEEFKAIATEIDRRGLQIAVHAIGDAAVRATIDGYEAARMANGPRDSRHRIEHIELIDRARRAKAGGAWHRRLAPAFASGGGDGLSVASLHRQGGADPLAGQFPDADAGRGGCAARLRLGLAGDGRVRAAKHPGGPDTGAL